jgi:ribosomal protein S18 acetylase RimI-like enzyme
MILPMEVRRATAVDANRIQELYANHRNSAVVLGLTYESSDWRLYLGAPHVSLLVAEDCGLIQGFLLGYDLVNWGYVETLVVDNETRRQGIGSSLLEAFERVGLGRWVAVELCLDPNDRNLADWVSRQGFVKPDLVEWRVKLTSLWTITGRQAVNTTGTNPSTSSC